MKQRTCNIIMCCKGNTKYNVGCISRFNVIAKYMADECDCNFEDYDYRTMEGILLEALYDFVDGADRPSYELRTLFERDFFAYNSLVERICSMFVMVRVRDIKSDRYINGFTQELLDEADKVLKE